MTGQVSFPVLDGSKWGETVSFFREEIKKWRAGEIEVVSDLTAQVILLDLATPHQRAIPRAVLGEAVDAAELLGEARNAGVKRTYAELRIKALQGAVEAQLKRNGVAPPDDDALRKAEEDIVWAMRERDLARNDR